jgi:hypothetical protein
MNEFKNALRKVIQENMEILKTDGTVSIGRDCFWQLVVTHLSHLEGAPRGTNAAYFAREAFDQILSEKPFSKFVY